MGCQGGGQRPAGDHRPSGVRNFTLRLFCPPVEPINCAPAVHRAPAQAEPIAARGPAGAGVAYGLWSRVGVEASQLRKRGACRMSRVTQSVGKRGSLKWIQKAINQVPPRKLDELILGNLKGARSITWSSPISSDDHAEYRDAAFLEKSRSLKSHRRSLQVLAESWTAMGRFRVVRQGRRSFGRSQGAYRRDLFASLGRR